MQFVIRPNAENILSSIEKNVMDYGGRILDDLYFKLVSLGSDGAAVVIGRIGGVAALLKQKKPTLQSICCFAHRLELAYKDAVEEIHHFLATDCLLLSLYLFYHKSAPVRADLIKTNKALGKKTTHPPTRVGDTRCVIIMMCL